MTQETMVSKIHGTHVHHMTGKKPGFSHEFKLFFLLSYDVRKPCFFCFPLFFKIIALTQSNEVDKIKNICLISLALLVVQ
jgi:hypothetical protein